jgi:hypothetical protein
MTTPDSTPIPPATLTAADVRAMALCNIAQRAQEGGRLSADDWARLESMEAAERPDPLGAALADLEAHVELIRSSGSRPPAGVVRLLRDAALARAGDALWPDAGAAAQDLGVSVQTVRNWCEEAGIPAQRAAISRAALYRALWLRERERGASGPAAVSPADAAEQELRIAERQARVDERTGRLIAQAQDAARAAVIAAVREVREIAAARLPARLADQLCSQDADRLAWEGRARRIVLDSLTAYCRELSGDGATPSPTPEIA